MNMMMQLLRQVSFPRRLHGHVLIDVHSEQGLSSIIENWGFLPRAVKELAAMEEDEHAKTSTSTLLEADRLKGIYDEVLTVILASSKKSTNVIDQKRG